MTILLWILAVLGTTLLSLIMLALILGIATVMGAIVYVAFSAWLEGKVP